MFSRKALQLAQPRLQTLQGHYSGLVSKPFGPVYRQSVLLGGYPDVVKEAGVRYRFCFATTGDARKDEGPWLVRAERSFQNCFKASA